MKILVITSLFPNRIEQTRGMYNKQQIQELSKLSDLKVVAPLPWAPTLKMYKNRYFSSRVPNREMIDGIEVYHPRYFMIPKFGRSLYGFCFFLSLLGKIKEIYNDFKFDLIFVPWAYPDGFGSFLIARRFNKPIIIEALGTDINLYTKYFFRRKMITYALRNSDKVIAVSSALKKRMIEIGVPEERIIVILNGVDSNLFKPMDKEKCRKNLGLPVKSEIVLFVGNLKPVKGLITLIDAFHQINKTKERNCLLVIVGEGFLREILENKIKQLGIGNKVCFVGRKPHNEIPSWINACDVFCLPSLNEGCPNVILEALACGKAIVSTRVGGIPELITSEDYGILVPSNDFIALAEAIQKVLENELNSEISHRRVTNRDWFTNAEQVFNVLQSTQKNN